jgi:hypothetical protein
MTIHTPTRYAITASAATDIITTTPAHDFASDDPVIIMETTGGAPLAANTIYYVRDISGATFKLATVPGGAPVNITADITAGLLSAVPTGEISGAVTEPGIYLVSLTASNSTGTSTPIVLTIGIEATAFSQHTGADLAIDAITGQVSLAGSTPSSGSFDELEPIFSVATGDDLLMVLRWMKGDTTLPVAPTSVQLTLKELEPDSELVVADTFDVVTGSDPHVRLVATFSGDELESAISNYEDDTGTFFDALAEIEWIEPNATGVGPVTLRRTSDVFKIRIRRDLGHA